MKTKFNFKSQIATDRNQSERLLALGLKTETADMVHQSIGATQFNVWYRVEIEDNFYPAWSLHRLIEMIDDECVIRLSDFTISGRVFVAYDNLFDNIIDCIEWLIKKGYFNKEYLV